MADRPVAFVTGASRGIGRAIAGALAAAGYRVAVAARTAKAGDSKLPGSVEETVAAIATAGGEALPVACDVTDEASVAAAVATTVGAFGRLDVVVNNAGITWLAPTLDTPLARWQRVLDVNLTGTFLVTKAALPHVIAGGGGSLIALTTTGVGMIDLGANAYWVAKAGVERYYRGLAEEVRDHDIAVNCLAPAGVVLTEGAVASGIAVPEEYLEPPDVIAGAAVRLAAARPSTGGPTGHVVRSTEI